MSLFSGGEIYRIWFANDNSGKSYIGQTRQSGGSFERVTQHINDARQGRRACPLLDDATRYYGIDNLRWQVLERGFDTQEALDEAERAYIKYFNSQAPGGYNVKPGGQGGGNPKFRGGSAVGRIVDRLLRRIANRAANRATWSTFGVSFYDLKDVAKIAQTLFGAARR